MKGTPEDRRTLEWGRRAASRAAEMFAALKRRYPALSGYLVFSNRQGQVGIEAESAEILREFPEFFLNSAPRGRAERLAHALTDTRGKEAEALAEKLRAVVAVLVVDESVDIELRFKELNYELIWMLQSDPLVDRARTPQTKASIRIVLGSLIDLASRSLE